MNIFEERKLVDNPPNNLVNLPDRSSATYVSFFYFGKYFEHYNILIIFLATQSP